MLIIDLLDKTITTEVQLPSLLGSGNCIVCKATAHDPMLPTYTVVLMHHDPIHLIDDVISDVVGFLIRSISSKGSRPSR